ncbi:unnamed protein product, partial [Didymodactylos carnosus]
MEATMKVLQYSEEFEHKSMGFTADGVLENDVSNISLGFQQRAQAKNGKRDRRFDFIVR